MTKYKKVLKPKKGYSYTNKYGTKVNVSSGKQHYRVRKYKNITKSRSLFSEPKYQKYSEIVEMDDPESAKVSVRKLREEFEKGERNKKRTIIRVTTLASNRANAMLQRENLSQNERDQFKDIKAIYENAKNQFVEEYSHLYDLKRE